MKKVLLILWLFVVGFFAFARPVETTVQNANVFHKGDELILFYEGIPFKPILFVTSTIDDWKLVEGGYKLYVTFVGRKLKETVEVFVSNDEPSTMKVQAPDESNFIFGVIAFGTDEELTIVVKKYRYISN